MKKSITKESAACLIILMLTLLPIQAVGGSLTLGDALETALANNPDLKLASVNRQSSEVEVSRLEDARNPTVSADISGTDHFGDGSADENYRSATAGVTARYNLLDGGANRASLEGARSESSAAGQDFEQERQTLFLNVAIDYLDVLSSSEILAVRQEDLDAARTQLDRVEALYRAGSKPVTDMYQQQASVKEAELSLISAQRDLKVKRLQLMTDLGLDQDPGTDISDPVLQGTDGIDINTDLDTMLETALENRSDVGAQEDRIKAAEKKIAEAKTGSSVTVDAYGSVSTGYNSSLDEGLWDQMGRDNLQSSVGIDITLPLYDAAQTSHAVRQADLNLVSEQVALNKLRQQIRQQLGQALEDYLTAVKGLEVSKTRLRWAEKALESVKARYDAGAANLVELNNARSEAVQARYDLVNARYDRLGKALTCAFYQGGIDSAISGVIEGGKNS